MKEEVSVAARFLVKVVENAYSNLIEENGSALSAEQLEAFQQKLVDLLCARFENHWFPEKPSRGQAYRCIRLNDNIRRDEVISQAAKEVGLNYEQLHLPGEITIWVDPKEVCCRFGESQGSFCMLANFKNGGKGEVFLDQVNFDEIRKKSQEIKEKQSQEMVTRKNGRRGFLSGYSSRPPTTSSGSSPSFKPTRSFLNPNFTTNSSNHGNGPPHHNHHSHHNPHHHQNHHHNNHGGHHPHTHPHHNHTPSPAAVSWYNSVNGGNNSASDMFSTSPPNNFYGLAKFSPPKYGWGSPSKWSSPPHHSSAYPTPLPGQKGDKYHWFNSNKATIKA